MVGFRAAHDREDIGAGHGGSRGHEKGPLRGPRSACSPDWTRTSNLPVNSRLLCQLSYGGPKLPRLDSNQ
ncbi:hypothetical protein SGPA1_30649 [Streptomyces misionensis JCM 4497]